MATLRLSAVSLPSVKLGMNRRSVISDLIGSEIPLPSLPIMMMPLLLSSLV